MGWTTRNHHKSGSTPSLKYKVQIQSSVGGLNEQSFILDGILYRTFKTILPVDPQELSVHSRSISFYILDKVALLNPHR